jgi:hypothetical protein
VVCRQVLSHSFPRKTGGQDVSTQRQAGRQAGRQVGRQAKHSSKQGSKQEKKKEEEQQKASGRSNVKGTFSLRDVDVVMKRKQLR